ncbi:hemoglobin, alpha embryonic 5 [Platichthys flesus]|uniref:hemoglobin, alpha embryonic 5 n=1 Tax=Platichthys flesus TaxID=8260 RepID=UPI001A87D1C2|nr:hemoglobin, alpha embryonic 5 [Platichthys flesus]
MSLSEKDKAAVRAMWAKIGKSADMVGADALGRMLVIYPQTKTYFSHWADLRPGSKPVKEHGKRIITAIGQGVAKIDDLNSGMLELSELHAFKLRVDPANFKILSHCILVVLANMFPKEFTPEVHVSMDKYLACLSLALSERYR